MDIIVSTEYDGRARKGAHKQCMHCHEEYWVPLHRYDDSKFCSRACFSTYQSLINTTEVICANCGNKFRKPNSQLSNSKSGLFFCSRNCKDNAQRIGGIEEIQPDHYGETLSLSKKEYFGKYGPHKGRARISQSARRIYTREGLPKECNICGYKTYVEICHITSVSLFSGSTPIGVINDPKNLIALCPNHHKEYDLGLLKINGR